MLTFKVRFNRIIIKLCSLSLLYAAPSAFAGEFGYLKGAETLPEKAIEVVQSLTRRADKGAGDYEALDSSTKLEYGVSDHFTVEVALKLQSISTSGLLIDAYIPKDKDSSFEYSGLEVAAKYKFLNTAEHDIGLSTYWEFSMLTKDPHSGQDKETLSLESGLLLQKYFLEGQLVWVSNFGLEATHAKRAAIANLPDDFEWPTDPEMEIELKAGTGLSYRFINNWYASVEAIYEEEHETEVGLERFSVFAGPSLHYSSKSWWATVTYFKQMNGGGEKFDEQDDQGLHLIEKTKNEVRLKLGFNF